MAFMDLTVFWSNEKSPGNPGRTKNRRLTLQVVFTLFLLVAHAAVAQHNFYRSNVWTNSAGGNWEDASWSLGHPGGNEVFITNATSKTIVIGHSAWENDPESLKMDNFTLAAPMGFTNRLLIEADGGAISFGAGSPMIGTNGVMDSRNATLLFGRTRIAGSFIQSGGVLSTYEMLVSGDVRLTNLMARTAYSVDIDAAGRVQQTGGTNDIYALMGNGIYELRDGKLTSRYLRLGFPHASSSGYGLFVQSNGCVNVAGLIKLGRFRFEHYDSTLIADQLELGLESGGALFTQDGGTITLSILDIGAIPRSNGGRGSFTMRSGTLRTGLLRVSHQGEFHQAGGVLEVANPIWVDGGYDRHMGFVSGRFSIAGGTVNSPDIQVSGGRFSQSGGSNYVAGDVRVVHYDPWWGSGEFNFSGGQLVAKSISLNAEGGISGGHIFASNQFSCYGVFKVSGGHVVANDITVNHEFTFSGGEMTASNRFSAYGNFTFSGGQLIASNIAVYGTFTYSGAAESYSIVNPGYFRLSGADFRTAARSEQLGRLILSGSSTINLEGSGVLSFADSHGASWTNVAELRIAGWKGSLTGGGSAQLSFGSDASGLTPNQVGQIRFINPSGFPPGSYHARILPTGEVVPAPLLSHQVDGPNLILSWPATFILQTATEAEGPYEDLPEATSPWANDFFSDPHRFFRLRASP